MEVRWGVLLTKWKSATSGRVERGGKWARYRAAHHTSPLVTVLLHGLYVGVVRNSHSHSMPFPSGGRHHFMYNESLELAAPQHTTHRRKDLTS
jgi:hypothetical protein